MLFQMPQVSCSEVSCCQSLLKTCSLRHRSWTLEPPAPQAAGFEAPPPGVVGLPVVPALVGPTTLGPDDAAVPEATPLAPPPGMPGCAGVEFGLDPASPLCAPSFPSPFGSVATLAGLPLFAPPFATPLGRVALLTILVVDDLPDIPPFPIAGALALLLADSGTLFLPVNLDVAAGVGCAEGALTVALLVGHEFGVLGRLAGECGEGGAEGALLMEVRADAGLPSLPMAGLVA